MSRQCAECGTECPDAAKFCPDCGKPLPAAAEAPPMRLTDVLREWLTSEEWEEQPEVDAEAGDSSTAFGFTVGDFSLECYFATHEQTGFFKLYMYNRDTKVPEKRLDEVLKFCNLMNCAIPVGTVHLLAEHRVIRFFASIDLENAAFEPVHISNLLAAGVRVMASTLPRFMAVCFAGKSAEEAMEMEIET